jgi:hypothetical protein
VGQKQEAAMISKKLSACMTLLLKRGLHWERFIPAMVNPRWLWSILTRSLLDSNSALPHVARAGALMVLNRPGEAEQVVAGVAVAPIRQYYGNGYYDDQ